MFKLGFIHCVRPTKFSILGKVLKKDSTTLRQVSLKISKYLLETEKTFLDRLNGLLNCIFDNGVLHAKFNKKLGWLFGQ